MLLPTGQCACALHFHCFLQAGSNLADLKRFVDYALKKPDVYLVTMRQLIGAHARM